MANKEFIKLPESELEVMQAIWTLNAQGEKFISAGLIMKRFPALTRLKLTTVLTLITRLQSKGFVRSEKVNRANCYTPLIDFCEYRNFATDDFVKKLYSGNRMGLISTLIQTEALTDTDVVVLKKMVDQIAIK